MPLGFPESTRGYCMRSEERVFAPGDFMLMAGHSAKDEDLLKETVWVG